MRAGKNFPTKRYAQTKKEIPLKAIENGREEDADQTEKGHRKGGKET